MALRSRIYCKTVYIPVVLDDQRVSENRQDAHDHAIVLIKFSNMRPQFYIVKMGAVGDTHFSLSSKHIYLTTLIALPIMFSLCCKNGWSN